MSEIRVLHLSDIKDCAEPDRKFLEAIRSFFKNKLNRVIGNTWLLPYYIHELDFTDNEQLIIPESIMTLSQLEILSFNNNQNIVEIPEIVRYCQSLRELYIEQKFLHKLPEWLDQLPNLNNLNLLRLHITSIPESIGNCTHLKELRIEDGYNLKSLPESIGNCSQLEVLTIRGTPLESVPDSIVKLEGLKYVSFIVTTFREIPWFIGWLPNLIKFGMDDQFVEEMSKELLNKYHPHKNAEDIKKFQAEVRQIYPPPPEYSDILNEPM
jgi:Leucine-rich repeat (LRR) protein